VSCHECGRPTWSQCQECRNPSGHFATCYVCKERFPEDRMHEHWQRDWELVCEGCYGDGEDEFADAREYDNARRGNAMNVRDVR